MRIPWKVKRAMLRAFDRVQKHVEQYVRKPGHEARARTLKDLWDLMDDILAGNVSEVPYDVIPSELKIFDGGWSLFELFETLQDLIDWHLNPGVVTTREIGLKFSAIGQRKYEEHGNDIIFPRKSITPAARRAILAQYAGIRGVVCEKIHDTFITITGQAGFTSVDKPSNVRLDEVNRRWDVVSS